MPVYSYRCEACGFQFDQAQKFTENSLIRCPECGKKALHKVYSPVGIVFKGSGFYATDHRSPSGMSRSGSNNDEKQASEKTTESKSADSKPSESKPVTEKVKESAEKTEGKD